MTAKSKPKAKASAKKKAPAKKKATTRKKVPAKRKPAAKKTPAKRKSTRTKKAATTETDKDLGGRPSKYHPDLDDLAKKLCLLGATDEELAEDLEIGVTTLNRWKKEHPTFRTSILSGKRIADAEIANSLYHKAKGFSHPEDKIFQYEGQPVIVPTEKHHAPDTAAARLWLINRQPDKWRERIDVTSNGQGFQLIIHDHLNPDHWPGHPMAGPPRAPEDR